MPLHQLAMNALGWIPACARMTSKRRKRQANKRMFGMELSTFVSRKLAARQTRTAFKFVSIIEPHPPSPSFSRTRESIYPRAPSSALEKVLTAENIYKRRDSVPHYRHSRGRGNPFTRVHRAVRWRKCLQRQTFQMPREQGECCRTINSQ